MSRSYKMPFHKLAPDREWQKMANRAFRRKARVVLSGQADEERHLPMLHKKEGDCWGWPSDGAKIRVPGYKGIGK